MNAIACDCWLGHVRSADELLGCIHHCAEDFKIRRGRGIRLNESRLAEHGEHDAEQLLFIKAVEIYKQQNDARFPTLSQLLSVLRYLGYRRVAELGEEPIDPPAAAE